MQTQSLQLQGILARMLDATVQAQRYRQKHGAGRHTCEKLVLNVDEVLGSPDGVHIHVVQASIYEHPLAPPQPPPQYHFRVLLVYLEV